MSIETDLQSVRGVLQKFQDGYLARDLSALESFRALFVPDVHLEVIGTGAIQPGDFEWCLGPEAALTLVKNDWQGWGDLRLDLPSVRIHILGDVAWLAVTGTVTEQLARDAAYQGYLDSLAAVLADSQTSPRSRLFEILRGAANTAFEAERGDQYVWPIRFTAVLVRRESAWLFHQIQFSFPTTRFPDVRV